MRCYRCDHEFRWERGDVVPEPAATSTPPVVRAAQAVDQAEASPAEDAPSHRSSAQPATNSSPPVFRFRAAQADNQAADHTSGPTIAEWAERLRACQPPDGWVTKYSAKKHPGRAYYVRLADGHRQWAPPWQYGTREVLGALGICLAAALFVALLSSYLGADIQSAVQATARGVYWTASWGWWLLAAPFAGWRSTIWYTDCAATLCVALVAAVEWRRRVVEIVNRQRGAAGLAGFAGFAARARFVLLREDAPEEGRAKRRVEFWLCSAGFLPLGAKLAWLFP